MNETRLESDDLLELCRLAIFDTTIETRRHSRERIINQRFQSISDSDDKQNGDSATQFLSEVLNDIKSRHRSRAAELIGYLPCEADQMELFEKAKKDPSWVVRSYACKSLGNSIERDPSDAPARLKELATIAISEPNTMVRQAAQDALPLGSEATLGEAVGFLQEATSSEKYKHRIRALDSLAKLVPVTQISLETFTDLLDDSHVKVRMASARRIGFLASQRHDFKFALPKLVKRSFDLAQNAGHAAGSAVVEVAKSLDPKFRSWIVSITPREKYFTASPTIGGKRPLNLVLEKLQEQIVDATEIHEQPGWLAGFQQSTQNRLKWVEKTLVDPKLVVAKSVGKMDTDTTLSLCRDRADLEAFALKEAVWYLSQFVQHQIDG